MIFAAVNFEIVRKKQLCLVDMVWEDIQYLSKLSVKI